jgi:succinate dehydrogenase/fumarate reductase iron-sulfur protein
VRLRVRRFDPDRDSGPRWEEFDLPVASGESVLGVLQRIRETSDSTLTFRYGCRFKGCGLCTVEIDGRPLPACMIRAKEGMEVGPLGSFPVLRDLVIDRRPLAELFARHRLHLRPREGEELSATFEVPPAYGELARCTECLACLAACPSFDLENGSFAGPLAFVKLAQLDLDPRDAEDRRAQAKAIGVAACASCGDRCSCPVGVPIYRTAIKPFLPAPEP